MDKPSSRHLSGEAHIAAGTPDAPSEAMDNDERQAGQIETDNWQVMSKEVCKVKPGHWYLCAVCYSCQEPIPLMEVVLNARRLRAESVSSHVKVPPGLIS
jgi:hypothetical protein